MGFSLGSANTKDLGPKETNADALRTLLTARPRVGLASKPRVAQPRGAKTNPIGGPGWDRTNDQPIMRPAIDRLRECQGVSGLLIKHQRRVVFMSPSVLECHGAVVKTVVKTDALRFASAGTNAGEKISQEFTWCVTACQEVSWRVRASQAVSAPHRAVVLMGCQRPSLGIRCNAWCKVCAKSRMLRPTPAKAGCRLGRQRPGAERVTPCLPLLLQRFLPVLVAATHRRPRGRDERRAPRQRRGNDCQAG
jgi:hypothetical protein